MSKKKKIATGWYTHQKDEEEKNKIKISSLIFFFYYNKLPTIVLLIRYFDTS